MAINRQIIKQNHIESVIRLENSGSTDTYTIKLDSYILNRNENLSGEPIRVHIGKIEWSTFDTDGFVELVRNNIVTHRFYSSGEFSMAYGADNDMFSSNILVRINKGTVILRLLKTAGYTPKFKPEQNGGIETTILTADDEYLITDDDKLVLGA